MKHFLNMQKEFNLRKMNYGMNIKVKSNLIRCLAVLFMIFIIMASATANVFASAPKVVASGAIAFCASDNYTSYSKNVDKRIPPWSTTKLLTVLLAMENLKLDDTITISQETENVGETQIYLKKGEKIKVRELIYASLLCSANDAAAALGQGISGNRKNFAKLMNKRAKELGCTNSNFVNAHGCKNSMHYSTAHDIMLITKACFKYKFVQSVMKRESHWIPKTNKHKARYIETTNRFIWDESYKKYGVLGGKTGTWDYWKNEAALATICRRKGKTIYTVVLNSNVDNRYKDTIKILDYAYKYSKPQTKITYISVKNYNQVKLQWKKVTNAKKYEIYRKTDVKGSYKKIKTVSASTLSYTNKSLSYDKKYYYKVKALNKSDKGAASTAKTIITTPKYSKKISITVPSVYKTQGLEVGQTMILTGTVSKAKYMKISWVTSDNEIASVSSSGAVTAKAAGTCTIYLYNQNKSKVAKVEITVKEVNEGIEQ